MYPIRAATSTDLDEVVDVLARLQAEPAHHIAYHGETAEEITAELTGMRPDWASGTLLATDSGGRVRGVLSVESDAEVGRAWLHGPYVDVPANHPAAAQLWHQTADALLERALRLPSLRGITDLELCGHRQHRLLADFAARHDFHTGRTSRVFVLTGAGLRAVLIRGAAEESTVDSAVRVLPDDPGLRAAVIALHERSFPGRTVTGRQLVDGSRGHCVVVLAGARGLIGYAAGYPQEGELYVDLVAVDPNRRSRGAGRALVRGLLRELAARHGARAQAAAVVALGNDASERMFTALGFTLHLELVSYRQVAGTG
ncbi:MAG TPA: GNAT family N-acetyltransferase [Actinophytocola sp.]|uniref:GNAT family N-acetyltransferase n=1 Tax=Actinophytocola sp. TaxID=1872138 RepID=UPI002DDD8CF5|nr:GNAT family N-acetyltransferase [Actinophytocola sp.]HEV2781678.1 GNAT family N-acetyltransferase [Actinophytocola sp.]